MLVWHPFALRFPLIVGEEWEAFKASIRKTRGNKVAVIYRVLPDGTKQGIDGRNRERACEELCLKCRMEEEIIDDDDVRDFILANNVHRRHMTAELRRDIVAELRSEGQSTREIAGKVGVSHPTVLNDLKEISGGKGLPPDGKVVGRDGKEYSAKVTQPVFSQDDSEIPYDHDYESPPEPDSQSSSPSYQSPSTKPHSNGKARNAPGSTPEDDNDDMVDEMGYPIPGRLRAVFADRKTMSSLKYFLDRAYPLQKALEATPWYKEQYKNASGPFAKVVYSSWILTRAHSMHTDQAHSVHQACHGDGCKECHDLGYFTFADYSTGNRAKEPSHG